MPAWVGCHLAIAFSGRPMAVLATLEIELRPVARFPLPDAAKLIGIDPSSTPNSAQQRAPDSHTHSPLQVVRNFLIRWPALNSAYTWSGHSTADR